MTDTIPSIGEGLNGVVSGMLAFAASMPSKPVCWRRGLQRPWILQDPAQCEPCAKRAVWDAFVRAIRHGCAVNPVTGKCEFEEQNFKTAIARPESFLQFEQAKKWDGKRCVYIHGDAGTGKTFLAHCLMHMAVQRRAAAWWKVNAPLQTSAVLLSSEDALCASETGAIDFCGRVYQFGRVIAPEWAVGPSTLIFDDLCKGDWNQHTVPALFDLLDRRMRAWRPTIITSQSSLSEMAGVIANGVRGEVRAGERFSKPIIDRLRINGLEPMVLEFHGESLRGKAEQARACAGSD